MRAVKSRIRGTENFGRAYLHTVEELSMFHCAGIGEADNSLFQTHDDRTVVSQQVI